MVAPPVFFGPDIVPHKLICPSHVVGIPLAVEIDLGAVGHRFDRFLQLSHTFGPHHFGAAVGHNRPDGGVEQQGSDLEAVFIHAEVSVPVVVGKLIGQSPVVVDVEVANAAHGGFVVGEGGGNGGLDLFLFAEITPCISLVALLHFGIAGRAFEGISGVVLEKDNRRIVLVPVPGGICLEIRVVGTDPGLPVDDDVGAEGFTEFFEGLAVNLPGQVDAEAVDAKFIDPVPALVNEPALHHRAVFGFDFVAVFANQFQVVVAVIILLIEDAPVEMVGVFVHVLGRVVGHEVDDHGDVFIVKCLHQIAELLAFGAWLGAALAVAGFHGKAMRGAVAPLVIFQRDSLLNHEGIVFKGGSPPFFGIVEVLLHGHEVHHIDAEVHEVIKANRFSPLVFQAALHKGRDGSFFIS